MSKNRNLTLYSAKLRDRNCFGAVAFIRNAGAKIRQNLKIGKFLPKYFFVCEENATFAAD